MTSRVVVTGAHVISPIGTTWSQTVSALRSGQCGIAPITLFDTTGFPVKMAGEVDLAVADDDRRTRIQILLDTAAGAAVSQSGIDPRRGRVDVCVGVGRQPMSLAALCAGSLSRQHVEGGHEGQARRLAGRLGCRGRHRSVYTACATGNDVIGTTVQGIKWGETETAICAVADSQISPISLLELSLLRLLAEPRATTERHPRPFDRDRGGFVVGEGAAAFVLESLERARSRRAPILAEIAGYGSTSDGHALTHGHPQGRGMIGAMRAALFDAGLSPLDIDAVNSHGTATAIGDAIEAKAINAVFHRVPVSGTKSMTGHLLAASSGVELAFCLIALQHQFIPPTIHHDNADPLCDLDCVPHEARVASVRTVMSNAFGTGGQNAVVVVRSVEAA